MIFRFVAAALMLTTLLGCESARLDRLEKQNQEILAELHHQQALQDFELESKCAQAAKSYFNETREDYQRTPALGASLKEILATLNYQNHYNKSMNRCIIWITSIEHAPERGLLVRSDDVNDVYDRQTYASYFGPANPQNGSPTQCSVGDDGCTSFPEFDKKIKHYMTD